MSDWTIVEAGAVTFGPESWARHTFTSELRIRGTVASLPADEPPAGVIVLGSCSLYPVTDSRPTPFDASYEQYTGPTTEVRASDVLATYGKESRTKQSVYDDQVAAVLALRNSKLTEGVEDPSDPSTFFRLDASEVAKVGLVNANIGTAKYTLDTDVEDFGVWKTNGDIRNLGTLGEAKNTGKRLSDRIMTLDECTRVHIVNLGELLNDTIGWAGGYTGPGHGAPFTAQDLAEYDFTTTPGLCWPT